MRVRELNVLASLVSGVCVGVSVGVSVGGEGVYVCVGW